MDIDVAVVCDGASVPPDGKLNILGAFDTIFAPKLPAMHPNLTIAYRLRITIDEEIPKKFDLSLLDPKGKTVMEIKNSEVKLVQKKRTRNDGLINLVFNLSGIVFKSYGEYKIKLFNKNKVLKELPFHVQEKNE